MTRAESPTKGGRGDSDVVDLAGNSKRCANYPAPSLAGLAKANAFPLKSRELLVCQ